MMGTALMMLAGSGSDRLRKIQAALLMFLTLVTAYDLTMTSRQLWAERSAWRAAATQNAAEAAVHKERFDTLHKRSEMTGKIKIILLLGLLAVATQADIKKDSQNVPK